jgi:ketosteroid isomerase-like protein
MSQQGNVERLRAVYDAFLTSGLTLDFMAEDIEFRQPDEAGGGEGVYHGHEGVIKGVQELLDVFDGMNAVPEEFLLAEPYIVVLVRLQGRAKASGVPIDQPYAHVWRFRGDQADLWYAYSDRQEALKFVGLAD